MTIKESSAFFVGSYGRCPFALRLLFRLKAYTRRERTASRASRVGNDVLIINRTTCIYLEQSFFKPDNGERPISSGRIVKSLHIQLDTETLSTATEYGWVLESPTIEWSHEPGKVVGVERNPT